MKKSIAVGILLLSCCLGLAQAQGNEPAFEQWKAQFEAGDYEKLLVSVESSLASEAPHPYAINAWVAAHKAIGDLEEALAAGSESWRKEAGDFVAITDLADKGRDRELYDRYGSPGIGNFHEQSWADFFNNTSEVSSAQFKDTFFSYLEREDLTFRTVWVASYLMENNERIRRWLEEEYDKGTFDESTLLGRFIYRQAVMHHQSNYDLLALLENEKELLASDAFANRFLAHQLNGLERFEEAGYYYNRAFELNPFYGLNLPTVAETKASLSRFEEAEAVVRRAAKLYAPNDTERYFYREWSSVLAGAGHRGKEREVLEQALKMFPEDPVLNYRMGRLETAGNRGEHAIPYLKRAVEAEPANFVYRRYYLEALNAANMIDDFLMAYEELSGRFEALNPALYSEISEMYDKYQEYDLALETLDYGIEQYPESGWLYREKAQLQQEVGDIDGALQSMHTSVEVDEMYSWAAQQFDRLLKASGLGDTGLEEALRELAFEYHWVEETWEEWADAVNGYDAKMEVWNLAMEQNPHALFPYERVLRDLLWPRRQWATALDNLERIGTALDEPYASADDRVGLHFERGIVYIAKIRNEGLSEEEYRQGLAHFKNYLDAGGYPGAYYQYVYELHHGRDNDEAAAEALRQWILYRPNTHTNRGKTVTEMAAQFPDRFVIYNELLERQPHDWQNWKSLIQYNSVYGGSAINAIRLGREFRQRFPDRKDEIQNFIAISYGKLGSNIKHFEDAYGDDNVIGNSTRYVDWFISAKKKAWDGNTRLNFDWETNTATLIFKDGTIARQTDDPLTSRTTKVQVGDAFIEAQYDDRIQLTGIVRSDGEKVELQYDKDGKITRLRSPDSDAITFSYDSLTGKPDRIVTESDPPDTVFVYYSAAGGIDSVRSSSGHQGALKLTQAFQELLSYTRMFTNATESIAGGSLPDLGIVDERYGELREQAGSYEAGLDDKLRYAQYLVEHTHVDPDYGKEALSLIEDAFYNYANAEEQDVRRKVLELVRLNYRLMMKIRTMGIPQESWVTWADMNDWLVIQQAAGFETEGFSDFMEEVDRQPLELLPSSQWLPKSDLYNTSYWRNFEVKELVREELQEGLTVNTVFIRNNGDVLLGTNKGLLVYRKGYWQHLAYNFIRRSFQNNVDAARINATSDILSITESNSGTLFLGTADGLFVLDDYKGRVRERLSVAAGLPSKTVTQLELFEGGLLAGTPEGAVLISQDLETKTPVGEGEQVLFMDRSPTEPIVLIGTNLGIYIANAQGQTNRIYDEARRDGAFGPRGNTIYTLKGTQVWAMRMNDEGELFDFALNGELITTDARQVYGITLLPISSEEVVPAVQTDLGLSIYHERHYEHFYLDRENAARPRLAETNGQRFVAVTDDEVRLFERATRDVTELSVRDLLSFDDLGFTVVADGQNPKVVAHDDPQNTIRELSGNDYLSTTVLAKGSENELFLNDGRQVLKYTFHTDSAGYTVDELFYVASSMPESRYLTTDNSIRDIVPGENGESWVSTGNSVFRYRETTDGTDDLKEFNYFADADAFPCYSDMVHSIFKTTTGDLYAVCSNESHRSYKGVALKGGLLKYQPGNEATGETGRFIRVDTDGASYNWFVHAYTPLAEDKAILATASGFAVEESGRWQGLRYWKENASYEAVYEEYPSLFLGTRGAQLGDLWLFGSADGVIAYYNDNWFYPARLNRQLPKDSEYGRYGARHVNAVETSPQGKVYVGTDLGLLVYDSESSDPTKFIMENYSLERSIEFFNTKIVEDEQERIFSLKDIPENSEAAELIASLKETKEQIAGIKAEQSRFNNPAELLAMEGQTNRSAAASDSLQKELDILNRKQSDLLLTLQQREPSLYQAIQIDPLDLRSSRINMNEQDVVVQYLPMSRKLFIQVLSKNEFQLREVEVTGEALMDSVRLVAADLAGKSEGMRVGVLGGDEEVVKLSEERLMDLLSYLYENLIRPIENDLAGYRNLYVAPVGALNYLPFSALADRQGERDITYAVERYNIGYVSSMYLFNLIYNAQVPQQQTALLIGDPDGSLAGARDEVEEIQSMVAGSQLFVGKQASTEAFRQNLQSKGIIHLATHGYLNEESLKESWLLFSDKKFSLSEVYNLNLRNSSLVVLSACQTSLGGEGLEYATLSRAFLNAGTPSIIGTLWKVDDLPSKELMVNFYRLLSEGHNKFEALAMAKRELLASSERRMNHPSKWASYIMIGKP